MSNDLVTHGIESLNNFCRLDCWELFSELLRIHIFVTYWYKYEVVIVKVYLEENGG